MKTKPTARAWEADPFWKEVVAILTSGKKLRPDHYLDKLGAEALEQLRLALSCSGTFAEQQKLCPPRQGGEKDGELPGISLLGEIAEAMRQVGVLRELQQQELIESATKERCGRLGLDPKLTNAVVRIVGEEALDQKRKRIVGTFAISAAHVLLSAEGMRTKGRQDEIKIELRQRSETRQGRKLQLEIEKVYLVAAEKMLDQRLREKADELNASNLSQADRIAAMRQAAFADVDALRTSGELVLPKP